MKCKSTSFLLSLVSVFFFSFFITPQTLHGAELTGVVKFPLHEAILNKQDVKAILLLAASGANPNIANESDQTVWQLIDSYPRKGHKKKAMRYAINEGLRIFLKNNPGKTRAYLGDCGNPDCDVAEKALYLSVPSNSKDRVKLLVYAYDDLIEQLKKNVCNNLDLHVFEGINIRDCLSFRYCNSYYVNKKSGVNEISYKQICLIKLYRIQLPRLLVKYPLSAERVENKRKVIPADGEPRLKKASRGPIEETIASIGMTLSRCATCTGFIESGKGPICPQCTEDGTMDSLEGDNFTMDPESPFDEPHSHVSRL